MIPLTHFNTKSRIALNVDLIEKVEETPDTVITLTTGARYIVQESLDEIIELSTRARARVGELVGRWQTSGDGTRLRLVQGSGDDGPDPAAGTEDRDR